MSYTLAGGFCLLQANWQIRERTHQSSHQLHNPAAPHISSKTLINGILILCIIYNTHMSYVSIPRYTKS